MSRSRVGGALHSVWQVVQVTTPMKRLQVRDMNRRDARAHDVATPWTLKSSKDVPPLREPRVQTFCGWANLRPSTNGR